MFLSQMNYMYYNLFIQIGKQILTEVLTSNRCVFPPDGPNPRTKPILNNTLTT